MADLGLEYHKLCDFNLYNKRKLKTTSYTLKWISVWFSDLFGLTLASSTENAATYIYCYSCYSQCRRLHSSGC
ncbi:hypothetical protein TNCT_266911 [Trichonephila clavata]|uniref:Uncharacterized protein n=1 Tax=Trichonephila clavata TaxID=2740835 RepID=A0A8X6KQ58_TRICU|nr:hypothetical protein TNCT_266911 [Trichonephila clavata]